MISIKNYTFIFTTLKIITGLFYRRRIHVEYKRIFRSQLTERDGDGGRNKREKCGKLRSRVRWLPLEFGMGNGQRELER